MKHAKAEKERDGTGEKGEACDPRAKNHAKKRSESSSAEDGGSYLALHNKNKEAKEQEENRAQEVRTPKIKNKEKEKKERRMKRRREDPSRESGGGDEAGQAGEKRKEKKDKRAKKRKKRTDEEGNGEGEGEGEGSGKPTKAARKLPEEPPALEDNVEKPRKDKKRRKDKKEKQKPKEKKGKREKKEKNQPKEGRRRQREHQEEPREERDEEPVLPSGIASSTPDEEMKRADNGEASTKASEELVGGRSGPVDWTREFHQLVDALVARDSGFDVLSEVMEGWEAWRVQALTQSWGPSTLAALMDGWAPETIASVLSSRGWREVLRVLDAWDVEPMVQVLPLLKVAVSRKVLSSLYFHSADKHLTKSEVRDILAMFDRAAFAHLVSRWDAKEVARVMACTTTHSESEGEAEEEDRDDSFIVSDDNVSYDSAHVSDRDRQGPAAAVNDDDDDDDEHGQTSRRRRSGVFSDDDDDEVADDAIGDGDSGDGDADDDIGDDDSDVDADGVHDPRVARGVFSRSLELHRLRKAGGGDLLSPGSESGAGSRSGSESERGAAPMDTGAAADGGPVEPSYMDLTDVPCMVCGLSEAQEGNDMLVCENDVGNCIRTCHLRCCDPPKRKVPKGSWYCSNDCKRVQQREAGVGMLPDRR